MKILVTGGSGFIGSNLVRLLIEEKGCEVINLDKLTYAGNAESLADLDGNPNYTFEQVDISGLSSLLCPWVQLSDLFAKHQPDAVMHLAAESHVDRSIDGPGEFIQTNIVGTFNLLQAALGYWKSLPDVGEKRKHLKEDEARERGDGQRESVDPTGVTEAGALGALKEQSGSESSESEPVSGKPRETKSFARQPSKETFRFLHVSTDEVYGSLEADAPGFSETHAYDPHSPYSASKAASDHLARAWADTYGLPVLVTNCSNNYGPYQFPEKLIPVVILKCLRGEPIPVYGKGENIRDWLYVTDHAEALYTVLTKGRVGETYNIGGNNEMTNLELVKTLCQLMDQFRSQDSEAGRSASSAEMVNRNGLPEAKRRATEAGAHGAVEGASQKSSGLKSQVSDLKSQPSNKSYQDLITFVTDRPGHDMRYAIDPTKIRDELGWEPKEDFESGFRKTVQWYLNNREWTDRILSGDYKLARLGL